MDILGLVTPGKRIGQVPYIGNQLFYEMNWSSTISPYYSPTCPTAHLEEHHMPL